MSANPSKSAGTPASAAPAGRRALPALLALAASAGLLVAQGPKPIPPELRGRFGFVGPRIVKIGDGIGNLQMCDVDGDGSREVLVADTRRARLVVLEASDEEVTQRPIATGGQIAGFRAADVDGDGAPEILVVDGRGRLQARARTPEDSELPAIDLGLGGRNVLLLAADLDGDGGEDLVACSRTGLRVITRLGTAPQLSPIEPIEENSHSFVLEDLDGDGAADMAYVAPVERMNLRLRRGHGDGTFGPWLVGGVEELRHVFGARTADGAPALAAVEGPHRRVGLYTFGEGERGTPEWWPFAEPGRAALPFAVADFDGDGDEDLFVAQPERARLVFFAARDGSFVPRPVPSLSGIGSLAAGDIDGDGAVDLVLTSPEEDALAWKAGNQPIDAFPTRLPCKDKPVVAAVDGDRILVVCRNDRRQAHLDAVRPGGEPEQLRDLGRMPADPLRMLCADVGEGPGREAVFVVPAEGLRVVGLEGEDDGRYAKDGGDAAGFTRKIEDGSLALAPSGRQLLVVRERFVRSFRIDGTGAPVILEQENGPPGVAGMSLMAMLGDDRIYLDRKDQKLVRAAPDGPAQSLDIPPLEFTHLIAVGDAAVLLSPAGVLRVPFGPGPSLTQVAVHEPPTDRSFYWFGRTGDLDGDGMPELSVVDTQLPGPQVLTWREGELARALAVPVFETRSGEGGGGEPREQAIGDFDGDGREDLVLIAHDRVLIYVQEK